MAQRGRERGNPSSREEREWLELREKSSRMRERLRDGGEQKLAAYSQGWEDAIFSLWRIVARGSSTSKPGAGKVTARAFKRLYHEETDFLRDALSTPEPQLDFTQEAELADEIRMYGMPYADFVAAGGKPEKNPLTDLQHMETKKLTMELAERMERLAMHEDSLGHQDMGDHWREMAQYMGGAGWAHWRAARGTPFPTSGYAGTSGLEGAEWEVQQELRAQAAADNPCGAGGYGPGAGLEELEATAAANPVKGDGRWHRSTLNDWQGPHRESVTLTTHKMRTAKGLAECIPYKPRKYESSAALGGWYERTHGRKVPKGTKWLLWLRPAHESLWGARPGPLYSSSAATTTVTAHKTLDEAKRAGESALRKLPMPGARSNPAALVNAGILAGSAPIPSGIDSTPVSGGILAGSRPIPSGFRDPRVNAGLVDPPLTRRSKPEQPF